MPALVIGGLTILLLVINIGNQRVFFVLDLGRDHHSSTSPTVRHRCRCCSPGCAATGRAPDHGPYFSLGRWGLPVNVVAVVYQIIAIVNLAWPREAVYGADHWYFQYGRVHVHRRARDRRRPTTTSSQRDKPAEPLPEHRAEIDAALASTLR